MRCPALFLAGALLCAGDVAAQSPLQPPPPGDDPLLGDRWEMACLSLLPLRRLRGRRERQGISSIVHRACR